MEGEGLPERSRIIAFRREGRRELEKVLERLAGLPDLEKTRDGSVRPRLEGIRRLLDSLGRPQDEVPLVHLAGSKGKGSTALFLEAMFQADGLRTGVFLSPHLSGLEERFRVGGRSLEPGRTASLLQRAAEVLPKVSGATFFDLLTASALLLFDQEGVDAACLETGLGGRLDSTNVVTPRLTVVTTVEREHEDILGRGIERVAGEKAGILKQGVPLVTGCRGRALQVMVREAGRLEVPLLVLGRDFHVVPLERSGSGRTVELLLHGGGRRKFTTGRLPLPQLWSLALAAQAFALFRGRDPEEGILEAAGRTSLPGRFEFREGEVPAWLLDGAHTERSLVRLARDLEEWFPGRKRRLLFGVAPDKRWSRAFRLLISRVDRTWVVDLPGRCVPAGTLAASAPRGARAWTGPKEALAALLEEAEPGELVLVTGSFRLVGLARDWLRNRSERLRNG